MTALISDIIARVQRLITLPADLTLFKETDFEAFANDCMIEKIYPRVMKTRDDYFLVRDVFPLQDSDGNDLYPTGVMPIPNRAWGNTLRELKYIDSSGNYYKINPYYLENEELYQTRNLALSSQYQKGFIPYNSGIKLIPPPLQDTGSVVMYYIIYPSTIKGTSSEYAASTYATSILNITFNTSTNRATYSTGAVTLGGYIADYCPLNTSGLFDIYSQQTGMLLATNLSLYREGTNTFTGVSVQQIGTDILSPNITEISNYQLGGYPVATPYSAQLYIVPAGLTPFTPLMPILDNLLVYELAIKILSAQGYVEELQIFNAEHADLRKDIMSQISMRVECEPFVISSTRGLRPAILNSNFRRRF
jgi:hypothetical protein